MTKKILFNNNRKRIRVLVAPLDWGLGHATRCVPIIKELLRLNCEVWLVADKKIFWLLKKEFPNAVFLPYKGYEIVYSRNEKWFALKLFFQFFKIIFSIIKEKKWINRIIKENLIDAVISDNRLGMFSKRVPSVYITHQLAIKTGNRFSDFITNRIHHNFIQKYTYCWVPDNENNGLAGQLSHLQKTPLNVKYIGPLSRFKRSPNVQESYDLLICISGPEPQRSIFEIQIVEQLKSFNGKAFLIRGLPGDNKILNEFNQVKILNHLPAEDLSILMEQAKIIITRSGYTTIMDLVTLRKKAILIPTPGQTEQEYLAKFLHEKQYFFSTEQQYFSINSAIQKFHSFPFQSFDFHKDEYIKTVDEFVLSLKSANFAG